MKLLILSFVLFLFCPVDDYSQESDNQSSKSFFNLKHSSHPGYQNKNLLTSSIQSHLKNQSLDEVINNKEFYKNHSKSSRRFYLNNSSSQIIGKAAFTESFLTGYTKQAWNGSNWVNETFYLPAYDGTDYLVEEVWQTWNGSNWVNSEKEIETHNANGNWLEWIYYKWDGSAWIENDRETQIYDANGNWTERINYDWNGSAWVNFLAQVRQLSYNFLESQGKSL